MSTYSSIIYWLERIGYDVSVILALVTFIVYTILPGLKNMHGRTLRGYLGCQFLRHVSSVLDELIGLERTNMRCISFGLTNYFLVNASFFWLNVCCFDMWSTLRNSHPVNGNNEKHERKKFIIYSIYVWGCAILFTVIFLLMIIFIGGIPETITVQLGAIVSCFFASEENIKIYGFLFIPVGTTILCNVILFILTVTRIIRQKKETARFLEGTESRRHNNNKESFTLYVKLFIVMGMDWPMIAVAVLLHAPDEIADIPLVLNSFQGTIIFIILVCKKRTLRLLIERCRCRRLNCFVLNRTRNDFHSSTRRTSLSCISSRETAINFSQERFEHQVSSFVR